MEECPGYRTIHHRYLEVSNVIVFVVRVAEPIWSLNLSRVRNAILNVCVHTSVSEPAANPPLSICRYTAYGEYIYLTMFSDRDPGQTVATANALAKVASAHCACKYHAHAPFSVLQFFVNYFQIVSNPYETRARRRPQRSPNYAMHWRVRALGEYWA